MKWFVEEFIPSLERGFKHIDSVGCAQRWISEKQVAICKKYMKQKSTSADLYTIVGDWQYTVTVFKKGYGRFTREDKRIAIR